MPAPTPKADRRFYAETLAIGRLGMRLFPPSLMPAAHWHGHVEANLLTGARMSYRIADREVVVPPDRLVLFWANVPHQLVSLAPEGEGPPLLANLYLPLDRFLFMPHIPRLQVAMMAGGMVALDPGLVTGAQIAAWYRDYRSGQPERREILLMELNAALRRALLGELEFLVEPVAELGGAPRTQPQRMAHVVAMIRFILENLAEPMTNADVARVTGLHETYATSLFSSVMGLPPRRFIIRMRLLRARALLLESNATVASVAHRSGFPSTSQFHDHFRRAYGTTPQAMRAGEA